MSGIYDSATPYIASFVILKQAGKTAFVLRANTRWMNGYYGLPSGKVEPGETYTQAAVREAKEEAGVDIEPQNLVFVHAAHRHGKDSEWVDIYFEATQWQGKPYNAEPHKSSELAWLDSLALPNNTVPTVRAALMAIQSGQLYSEHGWLGDAA